MDQPLPTLLHGGKERAVPPQPSPAQSGRPFPSVARLELLEEGTSHPHPHPHPHPLHPHPGADHLPELLFPPRSPLPQT